MTKNKMSYECKCGWVNVVEGKYSDLVCIQMEQAVIEHEDVTCG
jgi:hypothetical protein